MFLCQLGSNAQLSLAELKAVLGQTSVVSLGSFAALVEKSTILDTQKLQDLLGGTVKIAQVFQTIEKSKQDTVAQEIKAFLSQKVGENLHFAIGELGRDHLPLIASKEIKEFLIKQTGKSIRYLQTGRNGLGAAVLLHQKNIIEVLVCRDQVGKTYLAETLTVQNIDFWSLRDRGKPAVHHERGLLPPKVARILLNLSLGQASLNLTSTANDYSLIDPFCGTGTIPFEAISLGFNQILGSDQKKQAIDDCLINLEWFKTSFKNELKPEQVIKFFLSDATQLHTLLKPNSISHLVCEPFLGKQTPHPGKIPQIAKGLSKLYLGSFKSWRNILKPKARLVVIFPLFNRLKQPLSWQDLVDKLSIYGYHSIAPPIVYSRPGAEVSREIWQFEVKK